MNAFLVQTMLLGFESVALIFFVLPVAYAASTLSIHANKATSRVGDEVEFTITSNVSPSYCGIRVDYLGITEPQTLIRINNNGSTFPYTFKKTFSSAGVVHIVAKGSKVSSALACVGEANTTITVVGTSAANSMAPQADVLAVLTARAQAGDLDGMYALGNQLAHRNENREALKWFMLASERGHVKAMNSLGFMHEEGRGTLQDHKEAAEWYARAALRGNADAMVNRGVLLLKGLGVPESKSEAYIHFSLATVYATEPELRNEAINLRDDTAKQLTAQQLTAA